MSKLLLLPLLLLVLTLAAGPASAAKVTITLPLYNNDVWEGQVGLAWSVSPTQPMETWDNIAKVEYWVDGALEHTEEYPHLPDPNAKGPLSILSWTYDGRQDGRRDTHAFEIRVWVWKQTWVYFPFPPTITWAELPVTAANTTQGIYNLPPGLDAELSFTDHRASLVVAGTVWPTTATVQVGNTTPTVGQDGSFSAQVALSEGNNEVGISTTDPDTALVTERTESCFRATAGISLSATTLSCDQAESVSANATAGTACPGRIDVFDELHHQVVKLLAEPATLSQQPVTAAWDGSSDAYYPYLCSNSKVIPGDYIIRVFSLDTVSEEPLVRTVCDTAIDDCVVTNSSQAPAWTGHELELSGACSQLTGDWCTLLDGRFYGGAALGTAESGAALSASFSGPSIDVVYGTWAGGGIANVSVDSTQVATLDCSSASEEIAFNQILELRNLGTGAHTLQITTLTGDTMGVILDALRSY